jgi:hypothetical protein
MRWSLLRLDNTCACLNRPPGFGMGIAGNLPDCLSMQPCQLSALHGNYWL